jgi:hypothetical protein
MTHTKEGLGGALGCVAYDALMLLAALSVYRSRRNYPNYKGLKWGWPHIAHDVMLMKSRSLIDFFSPPRRTNKHAKACKPAKVPRWDDILIMDFGCSRIRMRAKLRAYRRSANQWSAHLTWQRVQRLSTEAAQPTPQEREEHAVWLLSQVRDFIHSQMVAGVVFNQPHHKDFCEAFLREYSRLDAAAGATR